MNDFWLISPIIIMIATTGTIILLGSFKQKKKWLIATTIVLSIAAMIILLVQGFGWQELVSDNSSAVEIFYGTLKVSRVTIFVNFAILLIFVAIVLGSYKYATVFDEFEAEFLILASFSLIGLLLLPLAYELITLFVALELTALPIVGITALNKGSKSIESALKFLLLTTISSAFMLLGIILIYAYSGTTFYSDIVVSDSAIGYISLILLLAGLGFKIGLVPWHMWVPDVYQGSPTPVAVFLSTASKFSAFAALLQLSSEPYFNTSFWQIGLVVLAIVSIIYGNLGALRQRNIKRLIGYSTIAQSGYIIAGVVAVSSVNAQETGMSTILFYLTGYALTNLALFFAIMPIAKFKQSYDFSILNGMLSEPSLYLKRGYHFYTGVIIFIAALSLIGFPATVGFIAKFSVFGAASEAGYIVLVIFGTIGTVVSAAYYLKFIVAMFKNKQETENNDSPIGYPSEFHKETNEIVSGDINIQYKVDRWALAVSSIACIGVVLWGIFPNILFNITEQVISVLK